MELFLMPDAFVSLADIFKNEPGLHNVRRKMNEADVVLEFNKIFPEFSKVVEPVKFEKKTLFLKVENPAWRSELKFKEKIIIEKINSYFGEERILYLKFSSK